MPNPWATQSQTTPISEKNPWTQNLFLSPLSPDELWKSEQNAAFPFSWRSWPTVTARVWQKTPNLRKGPLAWGFAAYCGHSPCIQSGGSNKKSLEDVGTIAIATLIRHHLAASPVSTGDHWQSLTFIPRTTTAGCLRSLDMLDTGNLKRLSAVSNCPVW